MLAASGLYNKGAGCVRIVLRGCWLRRNLSSRVLAGKVLAKTDRPQRGCWLRRDSIMRVLAASGLYNEGAGCVGICLRGCWLRRDSFTRVKYESAGYCRVVLATEGIFQSATSEK